MGRNRRGDRKMNRTLFKQIDKAREEQRKVTETKIYYEGKNINNNPFCCQSVEIL